MNELLLSLALAFLGQGGGFIAGPGLVLPAPGLAGAGFGAPGLGVPGFGRGLARPAGSLPLTTLAVVQCLYQGNQIDAGQARRLIEQQRIRRGWAPGWEAGIPPWQVGQLIGAAGGCPPLLSQLARGGSRIALAPAVPAWPGYGRPYAIPVQPHRLGARHPRLSGVPAPASEREGFGLAPDR